MDEVTDRAVGLRHVGGVALCRHDVLHGVSAVAEVVEADHRQETQEEPEEEGRQPTGISLVGLHNLVRGATACKYNEFRPKAYIIGKRIRLRKSGIPVEKKAASRSDLPLSTHVVLKTTYANPKDYVRRY